jgi:hypothetical protein
VRDVNSKRTKSPPEKPKPRLAGAARQAIWYRLEHRPVQILLATASRKPGAVSTNKETRQMLFNPNPAAQRRDRAAQLYWTRCGDDWVLKLDKRKLGHVFRDDKYPKMWRSRRADRRLSDMANLSWAKNTVLLAAEREIGGAE